MCVCVCGGWGGGGGAFIDSSLLTVTQSNQDK